VKRIEFFALAMISAISAQEVRASSFDRSPDSYGPLLNTRLQQMGYELRFQSDGCSTSSQRRCRLSSPRVTIVAQGSEKPPYTTGITITADLLRNSTADPPGAVMGDALNTLAVTMMVFDPELQPDERKILVSSLADAALSVGHSEAKGVKARYSVVFDQSANGLLVIRVEPRREP